MTEENLKNCQRNLNALVENIHSIEKKIVRKDQRDKKP